MRRERNRREGYKVLRNPLEPPHRSGELIAIDTEKLRLDFEVQRFFPGVYTVEPSELGGSGCCMETHWLYRCGGARSRESSGSRGWVVWGGEGLMKPLLPFSTPDERDIKFLEFCGAVAARARGYMPAGPPHKPG